MKTAEENLIDEYFDAFNRHDVDAVMSCFHEDAVVVGAEGKRVEGPNRVKRYYEAQFAAMPDAHCELQTTAAHDGRGVAESLFTGTLGDGSPIKAVGAEVIEFADGKILQIRDYHRQVDMGGS